MQILRGAGWVALIMLAGVLLFIKDVLEFLGLENSLQSVLIVILPLTLVAAGIEWITHRGD